MQFYLLQMAGKEHQLKHGFNQFRWEYKWQHLVLANYVLQQHDAILSYSANHLLSMALHLPCLGIAEELVNQPKTLLGSFYLMHKIIAPVNPGQKTCDRIQKIDVKANFNGLAHNPEIPTKIGVWATFWDELLIVQVSIDQLELKKVVAVDKFEVGCFLLPIFLDDFRYFVEDDTLLLFEL